MAREPVRSPCAAHAAARSILVRHLGMALRLMTTELLSHGYASGDDGRWYAQWPPGPRPDVPPNFMTTRLMRISHCSVAEVADGLIGRTAKELIYIGNANLRG